MISKIYVDMDGVLADFDRGMRELCFFPIRPQKDNNPAYDDALYDAMREVDHFYLKLEPMPGALDMMRELITEYGDRVEILSAAPKPFRRIDTAKQDKIDWVRHYLGEDIVINIVTREQKKEFCTGTDTILIDDYEKNTAEWERTGGFSILYICPEQTLEALSLLG